MHYIEQKKQLTIIFFILIFFVVCIYPMQEEQKETSYLLSFKRKVSEQPMKCLPQKEDKVSPFDKLPSEVNELIFSFLPGDDCGLNYIVHHVEPTAATRQHIEEVFLSYLVKKKDGKDLEKFGSSVIFFSNHTLKSLFSGSFDDASELDQAIPAFKEERWFNLLGCCGNSVRNVDELDEEVIKIFLNSFSNNTLAKWYNLNKSIQESITLSKFGILRIKVLDYFAQRVQDYSEEPPQECEACKFLPGTVCCLCGVTNIAAGTTIAVLYTLIPGIMLAGAVGGGCTCLGWPGFCCEGPWNTYDYSELVRTKKDEKRYQENQKKIATLVKIIRNSQAEIEREIQAFNN